MAKNEILKVVSFEWIIECYANFYAFPID
jgi:hypothetical protein